MVACELLLLLDLFILGIYVVYTDIRMGVVKNTTLLYSLIAGILINVIYYCFFVRPFWGLYLKNLLIIIVLAVFLFFKHFWGGGDSKLLICLTVLIPGRLYDADENVPGLICLIIVFLIAYLYVIVDSIKGLIKGDPFTNSHSIELRDIPNVLRDYFIIYLLLRLISIMEISFLADFYRKNIMLSTIANMMIVVGVADLKLLKNKFIMILLLILNVISFFFIHDGFWLDWNGIVRSLILIIFALSLRYFVSGYNYQEIKTSEVKKGVILSYATVLLFNKSRIKDLPLSTTEDMGDRISELQAEAIRRWGKSKNGKETIVIVKKIPFAIFLVLGTFLYVMLRIIL